MLVTPRGDGEEYQLGRAPDSKTDCHRDRENLQTYFVSTQSHGEDCRSKLDPPDRGSQMQIGSPYDRQRSV